MKFSSFGAIGVVALAVAAVPSLHGQIQGRGGTDLAAWYTTQPRCTAPAGPGYYMPLRVYDDPNFTSEINNVLSQNSTDGAQRVVIPIYWINSNFTSACDDFYTDASGAVPSLFATNFTALMTTLRNKGYYEVILLMLPDGGYRPACGNPYSQVQWCGSSTQWGADQQAVYQTNLNFITNVLNYAFNSANSAGITSVEAVFGSTNIQPDTNCGSYDAGYCGHLQHHTTYGLEAKYATMLWNALANTSFFNGSSWFPGKNQIYGFETGYEPQPNLQNLPTLFTVPGFAPVVGLYDEPGSAGRPYTVTIGA